MDTPQSSPEQQPAPPPVWLSAGRVAAPPPYTPPRAAFWRTDAGLTTLIAGAITLVSILLAIAA